MKMLGTRLVYTFFRRFEHHPRPVGLRCCAAAGAFVLAGPPAERDPRLNRLLDVLLLMLLLLLLLL